MVGALCLLRAGCRGVTHSVYTGHHGSQALGCVEPWTVMSHPGLLSRSQAGTCLLQLNPVVLGRRRLPWWGEAEDRALPSPGSSQLSVSMGTGSYQLQ